MPINPEYFDYCLPDEMFYERRAANSESPFDIPEPPDVWQIQTSSPPWIMLFPRSSTLPRQGWKIHVSATLENAGDILDTVAKYCYEHDLAFKFIMSRERLLAMNAKYANRGSSGKFIAIYPTDDTILEDTVQELSTLLSGYDGPYILSDLRIGGGPVYIRYGAFTTKDPDVNGIPQLQAPDGLLVPDERRPGFHPPDWAKLPRSFDADIASYREPARLEYEPVEALHFSNGGGVYLAHRAGDRRLVVLKEARPNAGLDVDGTDAVARLRHEVRVLERLQGIVGVPALLDYFELEGHFYMVSEYVDGLDLKRETMQRTPILRPITVERDVAAFTAWALGIATEMRRIVRDIHARGVILGDIHPKNVIIDRAGRVVFIDFEFSQLDDPGWRSPQGAPGFRPPSYLAGAQADKWSLAVLQLDLFLPQAQLADHDPRKFHEVLEAAKEKFSLPDDFTQELMSDVEPSVAREQNRLKVNPGDVRLSRTDVTERYLTGAPVSIDEQIDSIAQGILASATPGSPERLYPGDITQFTRGETLSLAHGCGGVLMALDLADIPVPREHIDWFEARVRDTQTHPSGLLNGMAGIYLAAKRLHLEESADHALGRILNTALDEQDVSFYSGLSGIGFALCLAHGWSPDRRAEVDDILDHIDAILSARLGTAAEVIGRTQAGLFYGWTGAAVFWCLLASIRDDSSYLKFAEEAIGRDLDGCLVTDNDTLEANDGWRTLPYLGIGPVATGAVMRYLMLRGFHQLNWPKRLEQIDRAEMYDQYGYPLLSFGVAGQLLGVIVTTLLDPPESGAAQQVKSGVIAHHLEALRLHTVTYSGHLAFRGDQGLRLSADVASGAAGVLMTITLLRAARSGALPSCVTGRESNQGFINRPVDGK